MSSRIATRAGSPFCVFQSAIDCIAAEYARGVTMRYSVPANCVPLMTARGVGAAPAGAAARATWSGTQSAATRTIDTAREAAGRIALSTPARLLKECRTAPEQRRGSNAARPVLLVGRRALRRGLLLVLLCAAEALVGG